MSWLAPGSLAQRILLSYLRSRQHRGKARVASLLGRLLPTEGIVAPVDAGVLLHLHPRDWIEYVLLTTGRYEPLTLAFLAANLSPGDSAVLAGVNFGLHAIVAARAVQPGGLVVGVEPQPAALQRASRNFAINGLADSIVLVSAALAESPQLMPMSWPPPDNAGAASLLDPPKGGITICCLPLADVLGQLGVSRLRLCLLDVQGFELHALAGLGLGPLPDILIVEADALFLARAGTTMAALLAKLTALGYSVHDLHGTLVPDSATGVDEANLIATRGTTSAIVWV